MAYNCLKKTNEKFFEKSDKKIENDTANGKKLDLSEAAVRFIRRTCEDLRFNDEIT